MKYIPSNKKTIKTTRGKTFIRKLDLQKYRGTYIETSDGRFYEGTIIESGKELIKVNSISSTEKKFGNNSPTIAFNTLNPSIKNHLSKTKDPSVVRNVPNEEDYFRGYYYRYFLKRINGSQYREIDKETYTSINNKEYSYDYNLYEIGSIKWFLKGNVFKDNSRQILNLKPTYPNLINLFPVLNEFQEVLPNVLEDQYTSGGELYYPNGNEYIGKYHVHPSQGPMEGATHVSSPHSKLYYLNQLPQFPDQSYDDFLNNYNKIECYRCINIIKDPQVIGFKRSRLLGCPIGAFTSYSEAVNDCNPRPIDDPSQVLNLPPERPIDLTPQNGGLPASEEYPPPHYSGFGGVGNFGNNGYSGTFGGGSGGSSGGSTGGGGGGSGGGQGDYFGSCFIPNTLITMADGTEKIIAAVEIGDKVKSEKGESTVQSIQIHEGDFVVYSINNSKPFVTAEHPFKTIDGWKSIDPSTTLEKHQISSTTLDLNDIVYKLHGKEVIKSIKEGKIKYPKVYNLVLDNEHVYYANGYLVHNDKGSGTTLDDLIALHEASRPLDDGGNIGNIYYPIPYP